MLFQAAELRAFLLHLKSRYSVTSLRDWNLNPGVILRHDVDLDPKPAYDLALLEAECGVTSSFLFMTTSATYNPFAAENRRMIVEIDRLGFDVGLHFDPSVYGAIPEQDLSRRLEQEASRLNDLLGKKITSVSIHNPSIHGQYPLFEGYRNAYDPLIFGSDRYLSDSRMIFRTDPTEFSAKAKERVIQILLHPLHYTAHGGPYRDIFLSYCARFVDGVDRSFRPNESYAASLPHGLWEHVRGSSGKEAP